VVSPAVGQQEPEGRRIVQHEPPDALAEPVRELQGHRRPIVVTDEVHRAGKGIDPVLDEGRFGIEAPAPRPRNAETRQ